MENLLKAKDFNAIFSKGEKLLENKNSFKVEFVFGALNEKLNGITDKCCPYGKAVYFATAKTYSTVGKKINSAFNSLHVKLLGETLDKNKSLNVERAAELFNLPDDIRLVVVSDCELYQIAKYFASVKKIPLLIIPVSTVNNNMLNNCVLIRNGKKIDKVEIKVKATVLFDSEIVTVDSIGTFTDISSKILCFTDYRINAALMNKKISDYPYNLLREGVVELLSTNTEDYTAEKLFEISCKCELANLLSGGLLYSCSSAKTVAILSSKGSEGNIRDEFFAEIKLFALYKAFLSVKTDAILKVPDYNDRAKRVSEILGIELSSASDGLIKQINTIRQNRAKANAVFKSLAKEISLFSDYTAVLLKRYFALKGKKPTEKEEGNIDKVIKYAGDTVFSLNGVSLMRETGALEV